MAYIVMARHDGLGQDRGADDHSAQDSTLSIHIHVYPHTCRHVWTYVHPVGCCGVDPRGDFIRGCHWYLATRKTAKQKSFFRGSELEATRTHLAADHDSAQRPCSAPLFVFQYFSYRCITFQLSPLDQLGSAACVSTDILVIFRYYGRCS